jgi:hypothetical protein
MVKCINAGEILLMIRLGGVNKMSNELLLIFVVLAMVVYAARSEQ